MPPDQKHCPVRVSVRALEQGLPLHILETAFGPGSLGILLVDDLPTSYLGQRTEVLSYASRLARLPADVLGGVLVTRNADRARLECPQAKFLTGWSHGREMLRPGQIDTHKGSFYFNCRKTSSANDDIENTELVPEMTTANVWPAEAELPGFRAALESFSMLVLEITRLVARACDEYGAVHVQGYRSGFLERIVESSLTHKARLLHYFPTAGSSHDDWCASHIDSGCLTALTSAMYEDGSTKAPAGGLFVQSRDGTVVNVVIPADCLAFQSGEALQLATAGQFQAVPHFVKAESSGNIARNTLAIFTQPNLDEILDPTSGLTFAEFSKQFAARYTSREARMEND